ncbi:MAG TPA: LPXTG cell wall anchor domain-containing protein, partial [Ilumatobacteraceae bacterium]|nr:LPXTG cell wall anchor domain-containing protein [Ilumatobacteraceae bacterium]
SVSSDSVDSDPGNNTSSASIDVSAAASLAPVPPGQTPPANTQLPRTGNDSGEPLRLAGLMFIAGALAIYVARRRGSITTQ